jgi:uncharacterized membrane protein
MISHPFSILKNVILANLLPVFIAQIIFNFLGLDLLLVKKLTKEPSEEIT